MRKIGLGPFLEDSLQHSFQLVPEKTILHYQKDQEVKLKDFHQVGNRCKDC